MSLSWWLIAIIDAATRRSSYQNKLDAGHETWIESADRSSWITPAIPDASTWLDYRLSTQAEGAKTVRERA